MIYQLPIISDWIVFENLICDLTNAMYGTSSFSRYRTNGCKQSGIDILSTEKQIAIQCKAYSNMSNPKQKVKDISKGIHDILHSKYPIEKIVIATTLPKDTIYTDIFDGIILLVNHIIKIGFWDWEYISNQLFFFSFSH